MSGQPPREPAAIEASSPGADLEAALRRVERLEHANSELRRLNAELAKRSFARNDSAAASTIRRATAAERTLLRSEGWNDWPRPLRILVSIALRLRKLSARLRG